MKPTLLACLGLALFLWATLPAGAAQLSVPPPAGLVGWWSGDGYCYDLAGTSHGTARGGLSFAPGLIGPAFQLDGQSGYVEIADHPNLEPGTNSFTLQAWVCTTNPSGVIVSKYECGGYCPGCVAASLYQLSMAAGCPVAYIRNRTSDCVGSSGLYASNSPIADGLFHQLAMARDFAASQLLLYVDGRLAVATPLDPATSGNIIDDDGEADPILIGATIQAGTQARQAFFTGLIDEVAFFNRALSAKDISQLWSAGHAGMTKPAFAAPLLHAALSNHLTRLSWPSAPGWRYQLLARPTLTDSSWNSLSGTLTATGLTTGFPDPLPATLPQRFYRLAILP